MTEVGALPRRPVAPAGRYYDPVGLPLHFAGLHHRLMPAVVADKAVQTGLSTSRPDRARVPLPVPRRDPMPAIGRPGMGRRLRRDISGSAPSLFLCRGCRTWPVDLRPACLLPPKRLSTPRSARRVSPTSWGLLPGAPTLTRAGLAPAGLVQLGGRNTARVYGQRPVGRLSGVASRSPRSRCRARGGTARQAAAAR